MTWDTATFLPLAIICKFHPTQETKTETDFDSLPLFCQLVLSPPTPVLKHCLTQQIMRKTYQQKTKAEGIDVQVYFTEKNSKNQVIVCILYSAQPGKLCYNREAPLLALKLIWVII